MANAIDDRSGPAPGQPGSEEEGHPPDPTRPRPGRWWRRRRGRVAVVAVLAVLAAFALAPASCEDPAHPRWQNVAIGGGGYITGIVIHPTEPDLVYARTDIGGAYRWDEVKGRWVAITDSFPMDGRNLLGIESLAVDPLDADVVYIAAGRGTGSLYRSDDRGTHWSKLPLDLPIDGNADRRWAGERLAVDPFHAGVVLFGSRSNGLYRSNDSGASWAKVTTFTPSPTAFGIVAVGFDAARSNVVYASAYGDGLYRSSDGGVTWTRLGGPAKVVRFAVAPDGAVFAASESAPRSAATPVGPGPTSPRPAHRTATPASP